MDRLADWIGRTETRTEWIAPFPANALAATLDCSGTEYGEDSELPPLWHWMHFLPIYKLSEAGYDGHAALGGFLPPVPLPRRMWAGSRLQFHAPLRIGHVLTKKSTVQSVIAKKGRSGPLVFITVRHLIFDQDTLGIDEEHDIVYRQEPSPDAPVQKPLPAPETSDFSREITPDPVLLFRYSALTFNGHRIHYDRPFCTVSEGYSGLVVHGPLLATLLLDLLRRERPSATVTGFEFRALSPVFDNDPFSVHGAIGEDAKTYSLWVRRADGALAIKAEARVI
ncbi:hypothetical protein TM1040_3340 (plasmid) [Ruegeria sp. TM1040]|uniref:FAS1-like dehydratase domain-containing protein n=1 Tax=Ruegeria sp. (strain TM1040) TaxID=292414 RepID=UPI0000462C72|nr:MaoC family dehydratase N-terminal domain-containing protein [Ruegeria sp. TM1040]ABF62312.1 hypothetical protein TM1040_3340 [Ruegeria sp. TM1040]